MPRQNRPAAARQDQPSPRSPQAKARRGSLSRELILSTAYETVKERGLEGLSMPVLSRRLGASAMAIYRYFRNKDELLDALTARALEEQYAHQEVESRSGGWQEWIRAEMRASRRFVLDHPGLGELLLLRHEPHVRPDVLVRLEARLQVLIDAGFAPNDAARVWLAMRTYTWGFALWEATRAGTYGPAWRRAMSALAPAQHPALTAAADALAEAASDHQFEAGLGLLLAGAGSLLTSG